MTMLRKAASTLFTLSAILLASQAVAAPQTYQIDPAHSRVEFTIRHMFSKVTGSFDEFSGTVNYDADAPAASSVNAEIKASSIDTNNEGRDKHLKSPDFFDVANYPTLTFTSTKVTQAPEGRLRVEGNLTIHGITKPVVLEAAFLGSGPGLDGVTRAGFEGTTKVDRKDFAILWNKTLDKGGTLLGDEVQIMLQIEGVLPKPGEDGAKAETKKADKVEKKEAATAKK